MGTSDRFTSGEEGTPLQILSHEAAKSTIWGCLKLKIYPEAFLAGGNPFTVFILGNLPTGNPCSMAVPAPMVMV